MSDQLLARLEAVTARLEAYANKVAGGSGGEEKKAAVCLTAYDEFYSNNVQKFIDATKHFSEIAAITTFSEKAFKHLRNVIEASTVCQKPNNNDFSKLLAPIIEVINGAEKLCDKRHAFFNHQKSFHELSIALNWVTMNTTRAAIDSQIESADFYLNQVLKMGKTVGGDAQNHHKEYVATLKGILQGLAAYVTAHFKAGLEWNPKGIPVSQFSPGAAASASVSTSSSAPSAPAAPAAPSAPDAPANLPASSAATSSAAPDRTALFHAINAGGEKKSATEAFGLKKVTKDMKSSANKDKPVLEPKKKKEDAPKKWSEKEEKREPKLVLEKGTWFCENQEGQQIEIPEVQMKQSVYIIRCKNSTITIPDKCKSIQVDNASKCNVIFKSVVSTFEIVNSQRCAVQVLETVPAVAIDKTHGFQLILSKSAIDANPDIVTSNVSELNLVVPGAKETDDPIEIPLPEQYITKYDAKTGKVSTSPVTHGSG